MPFHGDSWLVIHLQYKRFLVQFLRQRETYCSKKFLRVKLNCYHLLLGFVVSWRLFAWTLSNLCGEGANLVLKIAIHRASKLVGLIWVWLLLDQILMELHGLIGEHYLMATMHKVVRKNSKREREKD